jgi:hypothetical protein
MNLSCNICKKKYSCYQSLNNHNKKFHTNNHNNIIEDDTKIRCNYCNKYYYSKYTLKTHQNTCSIKKFNSNQNINNNVDLVKLELIKKEIEKMKEEKEILKLKIQLKSTSTPNTTNNNINNINNLLNSNNTNSNNIFNILSIGRENIQELLSIIEKKTIIDSRFSCLEELVKIVHCGEYNQFKNILITNLKDKYAYKFDSTQNKFVCVSKNEIIHDLVDERLENIREIFEELSTTSKINDCTKRLIREFLDKMTHEDKYTEDIEGTTYKNFRTYKEHKVKILIYNNLDKISKDLAIILDKPFDNQINN